MNFEATEPQELAIEHILEREAALLFMGCGLGKTACCLHAVNHLLCDGASIGTLVVAPKRVINLTWPSEVEKWDQFRHLKVANLRTDEGKQMLLDESADLYLINYEQLINFSDWYMFGRREYGFDIVIWDESTFAKNHASKRIRAVRQKFHAKLKRHWGLTGTPTPNGLLDLYGQVRLVDKGQRFGKSFTKYQQCYFHTVDYDERIWKPDKGAKKKIYKRMGDLALTLKSSDWLDIPDTYEHDIELPLSAEARKQYKVLKKELFIHIKKDTVTAANSAVLVNKLLQVASGAIYVDGDTKKKEWVKVHDHKLKVLVKTIKKIRREKPGEGIMLMCRFRHEQARMKSIFPDATFFKDAVTETAQQTLMKRWNKGKIPILISHPRSIGHGLNLQEGGSTVVWYSLPWERDLYDQGNARLARKGQDKVTDVYRIITTDSMDEYVLEVLRNKDFDQTAFLNALVKLQKRNI